MQQFKQSESNRSGLAIVIVILVLAALLILCTPFLLSSRNADQASRQLFDRGEARIALDTASRHGLSQLSGSHPGAIETANGFEALDPTPWYDSADELRVTNRFAEGFYNANDPNGVMWDLDVEDLSGLVDLNSASPQILANLMSLHARLSRPLDGKTLEFRVSPRNELSVPSVLWLNGEYIHVTEFENSTFTEMTRGLGARYDGDDKVLPGPRPASGHAAGVTILDQRAFAPVLWRIEDIDGMLKHFDAPEQLRDAAEHCWISALTGSPGLGADQLRRLRRYTSVFAGTGGGREWQRATRLATPVTGGETGTISVARPRYFNEGCTVRITDGFNTELAVVQRIRGQSRLELDRVLINDYERYEAEVSVLSRRPVNINSASQELIELLLLNLAVRGRNERVVTTEAKALAQLIVESRPLTGHEDFLRRIVLPAAGLEELPKSAEFIPDVFAKDAGGFISAVDAFAIYANSLNANDLTLSFSTMPFCYTSRDTYRMSLRSSVNAKSGVERATALREEVVHVVPQRELLSIWSLQDQFDESLRLDREAPYWSTGPRATSRFDTSTIPPSRLWAHMGSANGQRYLPGVVAPTTQPTSAEPPVPEHVFADREGQGYSQLWAHRLQDTQRTQGRALHFDQESRDPEGRYLPDEIVRYSTDDNVVRWTDPGGLLCRPLALSLWFKPLSLENATILDVGGAGFGDTDRVQLVIEDGSLVLRVLDGVGDHPATTLIEAGELRYEIAQGEGPGLPVNTWNHIKIDVRGNRSDQMAMLVNGFEFGVTAPGYTELTQSLSQGSSQVIVESLDGFRDHGCLRIGEELVEYTLDSNGQFSTQRQQAGRFAGFGGRNARVQYTFERPDEPTAQPAVPVNLNSAVDLNHQSSTPVEQYGFSLPILSDLPFGRAPSSPGLGPFRVGRLIGVEGGDSPDGDQITVNWDSQVIGFPNSERIGKGLDGDTPTPGLVLEVADQPGSSDQAFMEAFNVDGGYAAIVQFAGFPGLPTDDEAMFGGVEIVRYSSREGNVLQIAEREVPFGQDGSAPAAGTTRAFVYDFQFATTEEGLDRNNLMVWQAYVVPLSVSVPQAVATSFEEPLGGISEFAQFTRRWPNGDPGQTEWFRYDFFDAQFGQLVRASVEVRQALRLALTRGAVPVMPPAGGGPPGGGLSGGGGVPGGGIVGGKALTMASAATPPVVPVKAAEPLAQSNGNGTWLPIFGQPGTGADGFDGFPLSQGVSEAIQFRGVMGTYVHRQPAGTQILPVFGVPNIDADSGQPGRLDAIFLVDGESPFGDLGQDAVVHWTHRAAENYSVHQFEQTDTSMLQVAGTSGVPVEIPNIWFFETYIGLEESIEFPVLATTNVIGVTNVADSRRLTRLISFPSGEMPRVVTDTSVGGDRSGGFVPSAVADEIVFGETEGIPTTGTNSYPIDDTRAAGAVLEEELNSGTSTTVRVQANAFRTSMARLFTGTDVLSTWPQDAGLVRIGRELLAYSALDASNGTMTIAPGGRGLLGSPEQHHEAGSPIYLLEHFEVSVLTAGLGAADSGLALEDADDFPTEGTVLIDQELIHYTRTQGNVLEMPRLSEKPGEKDGGGGGIFRGRYGTQPAGHGVGTPVILFPFRYWDRWEEEAEGPELSYFGFSRDELSAVWQEMFMLNEATPSGGSRLGVMVRTDPDVPWDSDPDATPGLTEIYPTDLENNWATLGAQSDRIEWRVFVDYTVGAFDPIAGQAHGWKQTPRLDALGVRYIAPNVKLRSVEE